MKTILEYVRTTLVGGAVFVLPLMFAVFIVTRTMELLRPLAQPLIAHLGIKTIAGLAATTFIIIASLVLAAFLFGMFARTLIGQSLLKWMQAGIISALPRFNLMQGMARRLDQDQGKDVPVVLVRTDAGWGIALELEEQHGDWCTVYVPGSPQWTSGSVSFAHIDDVRRIDFPLGRSLLLMRTCGVGSKDVCDLLAELRGRGAV
ncbi:MAG: DUF502 domain-containing protein [Novosphingobium sp.]